MEQPFAQLISPTGCYMTRSGAAYIQGERQSYVHYSARVIDTARHATIRAILRADKLDRALRAKIECFLFRSLTTDQWKRVARAGVDKVVKQYVETVKANAALHMSVIHESIKNHEKEL